MPRALTIVALFVSAALAGGPGAGADDPPAPDGLARLRGFGRPTPGLGGPHRAASGTVTAVDDRSVTIRGLFGGGVENDKEEDDSGTGRYSRWVRKDPQKPIVLSFPGWAVDCAGIRYTPDSMTVTLLTGLDVVVRHADLPTRRFPAAPALLQAAPHPGLPFRTRHCHLLPNVRVGDEVELALIGEFGQEECVGVTIARRPGGRVPHSILHPEFFRDRIDSCNAYQDNELFGTPIPDRFRRDLQRMRRPGELLGVPAPPPKRP